MSDSKIVDEITIESDDDEVGNVSISAVVLPPAKSENLSTINGHDDDMNSRESVGVNNNSDNNNNNRNNKMSSNSEPFQPMSIVDFEDDGNVFQPPPLADPMINSVITSSNMLFNGEENRFSIEADSEPSSSNCLPIPPNGQSKVPSDVDAAKKKQEKKRRKRPYWGGQEHCHPVGPRQPLIVLDKLSDALIKQAFPDFCGDKGHVCKEGTSCKWQTRGPRIKKPKIPPNNESQANKTIDLNPPISTSRMEVDSLSSIINSVASSVEAPNFPISCDKNHPSVGDVVTFRLKKASTNPAIDMYSEVKTGRVTSYFQDVQLIEVLLSKPDFVCVSTDGTQFLADEMVIDWSTVIDGMIVGRDTTG